MARRTILVLTAVLTAIGAPLSAEAGETGSPPRTSWGVPDLQGIWDYRSITPMERPPELAGKEYLTAEEAAAFEKQINERLDLDKRGATRERDVEGAYNLFWFDFGNELSEGGRTSLIVDPPDGRIPPLTPEAQERAAETKAIRERRSEGPEDLAPWVRCIVGFNAGPPMTPSAYNNNMRIVQTADYVVIVTEMVHTARIVPLDGRPHLPVGIRRWDGDSRGRWEGDTLVVETTNFNGKTPYRGSGPNLRLTERFTLAGPGVLHYRFTIDDPDSFTLPWTAQVTMRSSDERIYEYACHEGNRGMYGILAGARAEEARAAEAQKAAQ